MCLYIENITGGEGSIVSAPDELSRARAALAAKEAELREAREAAAALSRAADSVSTGQLSYSQRAAEAARVAKEATQSRDEAEARTAAKDAELQKALRDAAAQVASVRAESSAELEKAREALRKAEAKVAAAAATGSGGHAAAADAQGGSSNSLPAASSLRRFGAEKPPLVKPLVRFDDSATHASCVGSNVNDRQCSFSNICYNAASGRRSERHPVFSLFTGSDTPLHPDAGKADAPDRVKGPCIPLEDGEWLCHNDRAMFAGSLCDGPLVYRPQIYHGSIPADKVNRWVEEPLIIFNRHWPVRAVRMKVAALLWGQWSEEHRLSTRPARPHAPTADEHRARDRRRLFPPVHTAAGVAWMERFGRCARPRAP